MGPCDPRTSSRSTLVKAKDEIDEAKQLYGCIKLNSVEPTILTTSSKKGNALRLRPQPHFQGIWGSLCTGCRCPKSSSLLTDQDDHKGHVRVSIQNLVDVPPNHACSSVNLSGRRHNAMVFTGISGTYCYQLLNTTSELPLMLWSTRSQTETQCWLRACPSGASQSCVFRYFVCLVGIFLHVSAALLLCFVRAVCEDTKCQPTQIDLQALHNAQGYLVP
eukprot:3370583-Amphidinium_carterae.1